MNARRGNSSSYGGSVPPLEVVLEAAELAGMLDDEARTVIEAVWRAGDKDAMASLYQAFDSLALHQRVVNDPFAPYPRPEALGVPGLFVGAVPTVGTDFHLTMDDLRSGGMMLSGSPSAGKTNAAYWLIERLITDNRAIGKTIVWVSDLRGDYVGLARHIEDLLVVPRPDERWNILQPPTGCPLEDWYQQWCTLFIEHYALRTGSRQYLIQIMDKLAEWNKDTGHYPCMVDLRDLLRAQQPKARSDQAGYRDRCLERVEAFLRETGAMTDCEIGFDYERVMDEGLSVVFENDLSKTTADFITALRIFLVYCYRRYNDDHPHHRFVFVLDEQRHLIRRRS